MERAYPAMDTEADYQLADLNHAKFNLWFLNPVVGKGYPQNAWEFYGDDVPEIQAGDMEAMHPALDFLGLNYYSRKVWHEPNGGEGKVLYQRDETNVSARGWEIYPRALYELLTWLHQDYPQFGEIYVSENGIACHDVIEDGKIHDPQRISYLNQHLGAAYDAISEGVPLKGYFVWSLMDNFEWAFGYDSRFGLAYVDFETQKRILKDSAYWYGRAAAANALED
jgi:beta-glucosidase